MLKLNDFTLYLIVKTLDNKTISITKKETPMDSSSRDYSAYNVSSIDPNCIGYLSFNSADFRTECNMPKGMSLKDVHDYYPQTIDVPIYSNNDRSSIKETDLVYYYVGNKITYYVFNVIRRDIADNSIIKGGNSQSSQLASDLKGMDPLTAFNKKSGMTTTCPQGYHTLAGIDSDNGIKDSTRGISASGYKRISDDTMQSNVTIYCKKDK